VHHVTVTDGSGEWTLECDLLCVGFGLLPETRLARLLGCDVDPDGRLTVDESLHTTVAGLFAAGESTGVGGADLALVEGALAGAGAAAYALDEAPESEHTPPSDSWGPGDRGTQSADEALTQERRSQGAFADAMHRAFALREELRHLAADDTLVCRCEDVPYGALDPAGTARQAKLGTRLGMGPCQGRVCGPATEFMFGWKEEPPRPPIHPMRIESLLLDPPSPHSNGSS